MNKIKTLALAAVVVFGSVAAYAAPGSVNVRKDDSGNAAHPLYGGYSHSRNSAAGEVIACSGRCLLAGLIMGTGATTARLTIRNSSVASANGAIVAVFPFHQSDSKPGTNRIVLPILLDKGVTFDISAAANQEEATLLYLDLDN